MKLYVGNRKEKKLLAEVNDVASMWVEVNKYFNDINFTTNYYCYREMEDGAIEIDYGSPTNFFYYQKY